MKEATSHSILYRKPTSTERFITIESHHHPSHKLAAFNSMVFRMYNIPLSKENFNKEKLRIYDIAKKNWYSMMAIDSLIRKHKRSFNRRNTTSLAPIEDPPKRISMTYYEPFHGRIMRSFERVNVCVAASSKTKLKQLLPSTKDVIPNTDKPGVYRATCGTCGKVYIGQTRREMKVRA